jgi:hypothetical protein
MERQNWGTKSQTLACKFLSAMNKAAASRLFAGALRPPPLDWKICVVFKESKMGQFCGLKRRSDAHLMKEGLAVARSKSSERNKRLESEMLQFNVLHQIRAAHAERWLLQNGVLISGRNK